MGRAAALLMTPLSIFVVVALLLEGRTTTGFNWWPSVAILRMELNWGEGVWLNGRPQSVDSIDQISGYQLVSSFQQDPHQTLTPPTLQLARAAVSHWPLPPHPATQTSLRPPRL